jgi:hypothetical protein
MAARGVVLEALVVQVLEVGWLRLRAEEAGQLDLASGDLDEHGLIVSSLACSAFLAATSATALALDALSHERRSFQAVRPR